jgi:hypothetical protein
MTSVPLALFAYVEQDGITIEEFESFASTDFADGYRNLDPFTHSSNRRDGLSF